MTPEAQRIAIAEACGWKAHAFGGWYPPDLHPMQNSLGHTLPDFINDLNAMHEAEKVLTDDQQFLFIAHLLSVSNPNEGPTMWSLSWDSAFLCAHANASDRSEAFLKTLNLWKTK